MSGVVERLTESIAKAMYESAGHDLVLYPWSEPTANEGHKAVYRERAAIIAPLIVADMGLREDA